MTMKTFLSIVLGLGRIVGLFNGSENKLQSTNHHKVLQYVLNFIKHRYDDNPVAEKAVNSKSDNCVTISNHMCYDI